MFNQFLTHLEDGHPWKTQLIKFTTGTTVKSLAFKAAVFEIFKVSADQKSFRLPRHHFSPTLLTNHPGQCIQLLTAQEVHALDNDLVSPQKGYAASKYTVYSLLRNHPMVSFTAQMVEMYKKKYVRSPLLSKKWVLGRAESFSSPRKSRTSDLNSVTSERPLLPVKCLMPLELLDRSSLDSKLEAQTLEEFQAAEFVQRAMKDISFQARRNNSVYPTAFKLKKNTILHACMSYPDSEVRREWKKEADLLGNRLQPHFKVKMSALSPFSQWQHAQGLVKRMKLDVCEAKEEQMVAINSDEAKSLLQAAFGHIGTREEKSEFKQSVLELSGNDNKVQYDYQMKCLALAYFLDYGKSGYNRLKESSLEILPSLRTNERELSYLSGGDEWEPVKGEMFVQIIFDETKDRCGVAYNPITGKETGFTASKNGTTLSFAGEILSIVEDNLSGEEARTNIEKDKDPYFEPATYANNMLAYRLLVNEGKLISWKEVIALYHHLKENCEYSMNVHELRGLRRSVAYPADQFTQQNVNDAKKAFEEETISYQCQWLGCTPDFFDKLLEEFQNKDGCGDEILEGKDLMEERRAISMSTDIFEIQKVSIFPPDMMIDDKMKSWLNIIQKAKNGSSYSEFLMDNDAFKDYAAASMLTQGIKEWFKKIVLGQADVMKGLVKYAESKMTKEQGKKKHLDRRKKVRMVFSCGKKLISCMRFYTEEALRSQAYLDKCYDSFLRSSNRGRLTLVNEQYFHFGVMLMKKVSASVDQEKLGNNPDATANAKGDILKNDELLEVFLDCSKGNVYLGKLSEKKKIFAELVDKVINARFSEEIRAYREEHTARGTKYKGTNLTMREEIDVIGSRKRASSNSDAGRSIEERKEE
eukprot:jgi/Psemu1/20791/gm1.20791_g